MLDLGHYLENVLCVTKHVYSWLIYTVAIYLCRAIWAILSELKPKWWIWIP